MFFRKKKPQPIDLDAPLSPEADKFLAEATAEFNTKQVALNTEWGFDKFKKWGFEQDTGVFELHLKDGTRFTANGQILGSYSASEGSWEWAWNNPYVEAAMAADSQLVKTLGEQFELQYLTLGKFPIPGEDFVSYLAAIGIKATDSIGVYRGSAGPIDVLITLKNPRIDGFL